MKICFNIHFHTDWEQTLCIAGSIPELGSWDVLASLPMNYVGDGYWQLELDLSDEIPDFEYRYYIREGQKLTTEEWKKNHYINFDSPGFSYLLFDHWQNQPQHPVFFSSAFSKSLFARPNDELKQLVSSEKKIKIKVFSPCIERSQRLAVTGDPKELGNWNTNEVLIFSGKNFPEWEIEIDASKLSFPFEYKLCIVNKKDHSFIRWENRDNRILNLPPLREKEFVIVSGLHFNLHKPDWKCAGFVIPVFSLRSEDSAGIGDFMDLKKMIDWAEVTSQRIIQVLPVNDTTMTHSQQDSYPYNAISIFALHPLYLNLQQMGKIKNIQTMTSYEKRRLELNALDEVDYEQVDKMKWDYFREIFDQDGEQIFATPSYQTFFQENQDWLIPYAAYSLLREKYKTSDFQQWKGYSTYNKQAIIRYCENNYPQTAIYYFLQYHLHIQLSEVRDYAYNKGVVLKGDIPIGISKSSIEAWTEPIYFRMHSQAGAPPDDFSVLGQNWGFPTYRWERMEDNQYSWWKKRFRKMSDYFDVYRIDHILGFFRIWEIPEHSVQGLYAWFNPSLPLSIEEIEHMGLHFLKEQFITPHINECFLPTLFGEDTQEVCAIYLHRVSSHHFALKEQFSNQRKIQEAFSGKEDAKQLLIRDGLYSITNEVLFVSDHRNPELFHPRITASTTFLYKELTDSDRGAFDYLYWDYYYRRHDEFWKKQGYKLLTPLISSTDMLACGEDLGMVPHAVPEVMKQLQILSLEIERMPKKSDTEFNSLCELPYLSVCATSTHDMSTIREWWREDQEKIQVYFNRVLGRDGIAPEDCTPDLCTQIISNHLASPAMLTIIPLQDWLSIDGEIRRLDCMDERINIPANPKHYWRYRMHLTTEELLNSATLNQKIRNLIQENKRG